MEGKSSLIRPSKVWAYCGFILCIISLVLTILPVFSPFYSRQIVQLGDGKYTNITTTFYLTYELSEIEVYNGGTPEVTNETTYYSDTEAKKEFCAGNTTCADTSNIGMANNFGYSWLALVVVIGISCFFRIRIIDEDLANPMKWYLVYVLKFVAVLIMSASMVNIGLLGFIFFGDTTSKVRDMYKDKDNTEVNSSIGFGSIIFFLNSLLIFALFVQNTYEFKENFEYNTEKEKSSESDGTSNLIP